MSRYSNDESIPAWAIGTVVVVIVAIMIILIAFLSGAVNRVDPGSVGVLIDYGAGTVTGQPVITPQQPGKLMFVWPTQRLAEYNISQQALIMVRRVEEGQVKGDDSVDCKDKTGIQVNVDLTVLWKVKTEEIASLYLKYPQANLKQISDEVVRRIARTTIADICGQYGFLEIAGTKRVAFGQSVTEVLSPRLSDSHLVLEGTAVGEVYLLPEQQKAITDKSIAEQEALRAQYLLQQRQYEADAAVAQAEGQKKVTVLAAQAQAEAIRVINSQLGDSPYYIRYVYATNWDGVLPAALVIADGREFPLLGALDLSQAGVSPDALTAPVPLPTSASPATDTTTATPSATP